MLFDPATERLDEINEALSIIQSKNGLTFGTDSYLLAAFARSAPRGKCVELGGGTGVVTLLAAARNKYSCVYAVELQEYFAKLIERNAEMNSMCGRVISLCADVRDISSADFGGEVEAVISNPPYMRAGSGRGNCSAEMNTARREENGTISDFCAAAAGILKWGGYFTLVYRPDRMCDLFCAMRENGLEPKRSVTVYPSVSDKPCLILVEGKKGAAPGLVQSRPLIIYSNKAEQLYTDDMNKIYNDFSLEHLFI